MCWFSRVFASFVKSGIPLFTRFHPLFRRNPIRFREGLPCCAPSGLPVLQRVQAIRERRFELIPNAHR